jgi:hypothetical protein
MSGISIPMHDPNADRWVNGEISNEEWKAHVLAKYRAVDEQVQAARAQAVPRKRRRWWSRLVR